MIISKGRAYVFVHIPKTGGTSMAEALERRAMRDDILIGDTPKAARRKRRVAGLKASGRLWKHATLADIDGVLNPEELDAMFTFTLVRNPWDRLVSYYCWIRAQSFDHDHVALARQLDFEAFVQAPSVQAAFEANPARSYMTNAQGRETCDAYIRLERFREDAAPLFRHLGFAVDLPHLNQSGRAQHYATYYSARTRDMVAEFCSEDIARFGYRFDTGV